MAVVHVILFHTNHGIIECPAGVRQQILVPQRRKLGSTAGTRPAQLLRIQKPPTVQLLRTRTFSPGALPRRRVWHVKCDPPIKMRTRCVMNPMDWKAAPPVPRMAEGQFWSVEDTCLEIMEIGSHMARYQIFLAGGEAPLMSRHIRPDALAVFLRAAEAKLLPPEAVLCN